MTRRATTLVEILIVIAIIAILSLVVWRLFYIGHATFDEGIWRNEREQEVKIGFRTMQEDIKNLAGLSATFGTRLVVNSTEHFDFQYNSSCLEDTGAMAGDNVFRFYSCRQPLKSGAGANQNQPARIERVEYSLSENRELLYSKAVAEIDPEGYQSETDLSPIRDLNPESLAWKIQADRKVLIQDVERVQLIPYGEDPQLIKKRPMIIRVEMVHISRRGKALKPLLKEAQLQLNVTPRKF